jgi:hypothetical protein
MVDSNLATRSEIPLKELCRSLKVKYDAKKKLPNGAGRKDDELAKEFGTSRATIQRLIKLATLNDFLFECIDRKLFTKETAELLTKLTKKQQEELYAALCITSHKDNVTASHYIPKRKVSVAQADEILFAAAEKKDKLTRFDIYDILTQEAEEAAGKKAKAKLTEKDIASWFPKEYAEHHDSEDMIILIRQLLAEHFAKKEAGDLK